MPAPTPSFVEKNWRDLSPREQQDCIGEMARIIVDTFSPRRAFLFGSRARGDHTPESDVDLLVELDQVDDEFEMALKVYSALDDMPLAKDIVVVDSNDLKARRQSPLDVVNHAMDDARVLYERAA